MSGWSGLSPSASEVLDRLAEIALKGPIKAIGKGDTSVGVTLMELLGIEQKTTTKPTFKGLVITARRESKGKPGNRVNLFAKVPDWSVSQCKSSREIVERYGYERDGGLKLYATLRTRQPNAQGLVLSVDHADGLLREKWVGEGHSIDVAAWRLAGLQERLKERHPSSAWVVAMASKRNGDEYFHYRYVQFTEEPRADGLPMLLAQGTITVDHLIFSKNGQTVDKGPLFKIKPSNVRALFPESPRYDLMTI